MNTLAFKRFLKQIMVHGLMMMILVGLLSFITWLIWIYYFRGPVDILNDSPVVQAGQQGHQAVESSATRAFIQPSFHNQNGVSKAGIPFRSDCVTCHGDYPHAEHERTRAFYNAHSWFSACEVCHLQNEANQVTGYRWYHNTTEKVMTELKGEPGIYQGRIVPVMQANGETQRLDAPGNSPELDALIESMAELPKQEKEAALAKVHRTLADEPMTCGGCHGQDGHLDFAQLHYPEHRAEQLKALDSAAMVEIYEVFHLPEL